MLENNMQYNITYIVVIDFSYFYIVRPMKVIEIKAMLYLGV